MFIYRTRFNLSTGPCLLSGSNLETYTRLMLHFIIIKVSKVTSFHCLLSGLKIFPVILNKRSTEADEAGTERYECSGHNIKKYKIAVALLGLKI